MESLFQDIRFGLRILLRSPLVTGAILVTLTLGIGANSAMFSLMDTVLLHPVRFPEPQDLMLLFERGPVGTRSSVSPANFLDWRARAKSFSELAGWAPGTFVVTGSDRPEQATGATVTANFFRTLGARPVLGRTFLPGEDGLPNPADASKVAIISYRFWQENLGGDRNVLGRTLYLDQVPYAIVGVMGPDFQFIYRRHALWIPIRMNPNNRDYHSLTVVGRLRGADRSQATAEMLALSRALAAAYPESNKGWSVEVIEFREWLVRTFRPRLLLLAGSLALILLVACTNIASLLLARSAGRTREMALRVALGATRPRLILQLLIESLSLGLLSGLFGLALAYYLLTAAPHFLPPNILPSVPLELSPLVVFFTLGLSVFTAILFGLVPAISLGGADVHEGLKEASRGSSGGPSRQRFRQSMVVLEVAAGLILLSTAALIARSVQQLESLDVGAQPRNVLTARLFLPLAHYNASTALEFHRRLLDRVRALPNVEAATVATNLPLMRLSIEVPFDLETAPSRPIAEKPGSGYTTVTPEYWNTLGIQLRKGRRFEDTDNEKAPPVVIVNEAFAARYFPSEDPVGKTILLNRPILGKEDFEDSVRARILGVVSNVNVGEIAAAPAPVLYAPDAQNVWSTATWIAVRTTLDPAGLTAALRREVQQLDKDIPIEQAGSLEKSYQDQFAEPRFQTGLMGVFAIFAVVLAVVGIYGINAYAVAQRGREIAVRSAMGASPANIFATILGEGMKLAGLGVAVGILGAFVAARFLGSALVGVVHEDPWILAGTALLLLLVSAAACYVPARRAVLIDPATALRQD